MAAAVPAPLAKSLCRALLRACSRMQAGDFGASAFSPRLPLGGQWGSYGWTSCGEDYQRDALEQLVPGVTLEAGALPLDAPALRRLVRAAFRPPPATGDAAPAAASAGTSSAASSSPIEQAFAALRAIPEQCALEACSTSSEVQGVRVEAVSQFSGAEEAQRQGAAAFGGGQGRYDGPRYRFSYRIRVLNGADRPVQVLGRGWEIRDASDALVGWVAPSADNAVVGQQPIIPPGAGWEYESGAELPTPGGTMRGLLKVAFVERGRPAAGARSGAVFDVPVSRLPFAAPGLQQPGAAPAGGGGL